MSYYISGSVSWSKTCHTIEVEVCVTGKWVHASAYEMRESVLCVFVSVLVVCAYLCIHVCVCVCVKHVTLSQVRVPDTRVSHCAKLDTSAKPYILLRPPFSCPEPFPRPSPALCTTPTNSHPCYASILHNNSYKLCYLSYSTTLINVQ